MGTLGELLDGLGTEGYRRGKDFERICKWFLQHDPVYAQKLRRVWLWDEWPGKWGADAGIDLVAEDQDGQIWAIQAKAYARTNSITKRDIDTFLSESARTEIAYRLLIATTDLIGKTAKRTVDNQEKHASVLLRGTLEAAQIDWPDSPSDLRAPRLPPKKPREHQRTAIHAVVTGFERSDRGQMIMACGTGKTLISLFIHENIGSSRTLVLMPSLSLLGQTLSEWAANSKQGFEFLAVCSDQSVTDDDAVVANTSDLGFPVTTDPEKVAAFLRRRKGPRVVFATYQSSPQIAEAFRLGGVPAFNLAIADEAHRCAGPVSSDFGTILNEADIRAERRLFMTATPRFFTGRILGEARQRDFEIASMDDESKFGPVFHRLGFSEAIGLKQLTDYQVVVIGVDDAMYREWADEAEPVSTSGKAMDARTLAGQIGLAKSMRAYDLRRTISFHSRVKRAEEFARSLPEVIAWMPSDERPTGLVWASSVSGEMSASQRQVRLQQLREVDHNARGLLANARCLAEGVDVPSIDGVAFIDPKRSEVDIVQAVGRAIRLSSEKKVGTIVIPVFLDDDAEPAIAVESSAFKPVWDVVMALRAHDEELGEQLDELRRGLGRLGSGRPLRMPPKIKVDLPTSVGADFARAFNARLVDQTTASWEFWYGLLEKYVDREHDARVPKSHRDNGFQLGEWVKTQRTLHDRRLLSEKRTELLESLEGWTWDPFADQWEEGFSQLKAYVERTGRADMPANYKVDGFNLGRWVTVQRVNRTRGSGDTERERRLAALEGWSWNAKDDKWEEGFSRLQKYVETKGDARVLASYRDPDGYSLGAWVVTQRGDHDKDRLAAERADRLNELEGWTWDPFADQWEEGFSRLLEFVEREGHSRVPVSYKTHDYPLGKWVDKQRVKHKQNKLDAEREQRLATLNGWAWSAQEAAWEDWFSLLMEYVDENGDARVPSNYILGNSKLGQWVSNQRVKQRNGTLTADRERRLNELPGWSES
jgi:superfamily II DNA or RNA helicase